MKWPPLPKLASLARHEALHRHPAASRRHALSGRLIGQRSDRRPPPPLKRNWPPPWRSCTPASHHPAGRLALLRCRAPAEAFACAHGLALTLDADLAEIDFGDWDAADPLTLPADWSARCQDHPAGPAWRRAHCRFSGSLRARLERATAPAWAARRRASVAVKPWWGDFCVAGRGDGHALAAGAAGGGGAAAGCACLAIRQSRPGCWRWRARDA